MIATLPPRAVIAANHRQLNKICWKKKEGLQMADAIAQFFADNDIDLTKKLGDEHEALQELARFHFLLKRGNKSIVADFAQGENHSPMLLAHWYSRHRFDPVWNMRKSQLIRKKYREFLSSHEIADGHLLIRSYTPVHMVLTMPHKDGYYTDNRTTARFTDDGVRVEKVEVKERFYARALLAAFAEVRRTPMWKRHVYGGEYGLEIKRSKGKNGLHIHLHSLLFLKDTCTVNAFRKWLRQKWEDLTAAKFCHFETLYHYKKKPNGQYEMEAIDSGQWKESEYGGYEDEHGNFHERFHPKFVRKKFYLNADSPIEDYLKGVMECIKYHFKNDSLKDESGDWDVPLMVDILNNSRNLRFYSRFGAFYKQPLLNFNSLDAATGAEADSVVEECAGGEDYIMGSAAGAEERLINPWTAEPAFRDDYSLCVISPERLTMRKDICGIHQLQHYEPDDWLRVGRQFSLADVIKAVCTNQLSSILMPESWAELVNERKTGSSIPISPRIRKLCDKLPPGGNRISDLYREKKKFEGRFVAYWEREDDTPF